MKEKKEKKDVALLVELYDIVLCDNVLEEDICKQQPVKVKALGWLHDEDKDVLRLTNFVEHKVESDVLVIPKSLIIERKEINLKG